MPPELLSQAAFKLQCTAGPSSAGHVVVFLRPGLGEFLRRAAEMAELVVFTAGLPSELLMWQGGGGANLMNPWLYSVISWVCSRG